MIKIGCPSFGTDCGRSGIGSYMSELINRFDSDALSEEFSFELIGPQADRDYYLKDTKHILWHQVEGADGSPIRNFFWNQSALPKLCKERGYDLLFLPAANRRLCGKAPCPTVGTVHDLATLHLKNKYDFAHAVFNRQLLPMLIRGLTHIITVSQFSKDDIVRFAKVGSDRVTVIPLAADHDRFFPLEDSSSLKGWMKETFGVDTPYLLYISRLEHPGKNHVNLIKAFDLFRAETKTNYSLVLPGPDKERASEIHSAAQASPYASDIRFLGFVDAADVPNLYRGAELFVLPSYFEGFGLPVLEAMACRTPVITSDAASLPEVSGSHTPHFDPNSALAIKEAILEVLGDDAKRDALAETGRLWAQQFSWDRTVDETLEIFRETVRKGKGRK
ncbi:MAG: glycosyltransferase family 1 protein [Sphaerochaeta sp.]|nr:glycosyltransferase family 1 protein [Sphaerochaeta sp.]